MRKKPVRLDEERRVVLSELVGLYGLFQESEYASVRDGAGMVVLLRMNALVNEGGKLSRLSDQDLSEWMDRISRRKPS